MLPDFEKNAAMSDAVRRAIQKGRELAQANKPEIIGALAGGAIGTGLGALSVKRWKGKPSYLEQDANETTEWHREERSRLKSRKKKPGFSLKMQEALAKGYGGVAKAMTEHPIAGSLASGAAGASLGRSIAQFMRSLP